MDLNNYRPIVGDAIIDELFYLAKKLESRSVLNINSTAVGGGVAEILHRMIPLLKQLGILVTWEVIKGDEKFFQITKKIHNALHGIREEFKADDFSYFQKITEENFASISLAAADIIFIHDPQPIGLVNYRSSLPAKKWFWRCHIDFSQPDETIWQFLKNYIEKFDAAVFSAAIFSRALKVRQVLISPSIDPLSDKNRQLTEEEIAEVFSRFGIDRSRPVITQISRFDYLKDPLGVIQAYRLVKKYIDCQLVLAGGGATDDPEGEKVLNQVREAASSDKDIFVLLLPPASDIEINALQRGSTIILQKSLREGFGLTVAEALWKSRPVIASAVGGIPLQITHKYSGILTRTIEGTAYWIKQLLNEPEYARRLGHNGHQHIKNNFLITRHLQDYLLLFLSAFYEGDIVHL